MAPTPIVSAFAGNIYSLLLQNVLCTFITIIIQFSPPVIQRQAKAPGACSLEKCLYVTPALPAQMAAHQPLSASKLFLCTLLHLCGARSEGREMLQLSFRLEHPEIRAHIPGSRLKRREHNHMMVEKAPAPAYPCPLPFAPYTA